MGIPSLAPLDEITKDPVPVDISGLDRAKLLESYRELALRIPRYMANNLPKPPADPAEAADYETNKALFLGNVRGMEAYWSAGSGDPLQYSLANFIDYIDSGRKMIAAMEALYWDAYGRTVPTSLKKANVRAPTAEDRAILVLTVNKIKVMVESFNSFTKLVTHLVPMFGDQKEARKIFVNTVVNLERILSHTEVGVLKDRRGFVLDSEMPKAMLALAQGGSGDDSFIRIRPSALSGQEEVKVVDNLLPQIFHEGTHTTGATVDLLYRKGDRHYKLPTALRLGNAANYEQFAIEWLAGAGVIWPAPLIVALQLESRIERALLIVQYRATRAFVRLTQLRPPEFTKPNSYVDTWKKNDNKWAAVADAIGAQPAIVGIEMARARFETLYMDIQEMWATTLDADFRVVDKGDNVVVSLAGSAIAAPIPTPATAAELASNLVATVAAYLYGQGKVALLKHTIWAIDKVNVYDHRVGKLAPAIEEFLTALGH